MPQKIVDVQNLTKSFTVKKRTATAVSNISFSIKEGEVVGLLGPNGAGKTTTIHMLLGLITPTSGSISIFGKNFFDNRKEILKKVNFSSSYTHLPWRLTVWENLYVVALLYGVDNPKEKTAGVLKMLNLYDKKNMEVGELSSGWTTRLNLARTFINDPKFILLDEPTSSLDPESANDIRRHILKMQKNLSTTILWTSHNMAEVEEVCDRVIFLNHGKIIAEDSPMGLAKRIKSVRVSFMVSKNKNKLLKIASNYQWQLSDERRFTIIRLHENQIPVLLNILSAQKIDYSEISIDKPTLEDFFMATARPKEGN